MAAFSKDAIFQIIFNCKTGASKNVVPVFIFFSEAAVSAKINHAAIYVITGLYKTAEKLSNRHPVWASLAARVINIRLLFRGGDAILDLFPLQLRALWRLIHLRQGWERVGREPQLSRSGGGWVPGAHWQWRAEWGARELRHSPPQHHHRLVGC